MIRALQASDIPGLNKLKPVDWDFDFEAFTSKYFNDDFYYAFVLIKENSIVGTGNVFLKGKVAWLANIIIDEKHRGQGLGFEMTEFLVQFIKAKGGETQILIATKLGESVYKKVGFKKISEYKCFDIKLDAPTTTSESIRNLLPSDLEDVYSLDNEVNGEDRRHLLDKYYKTGLGYFDTGNKLLGIYLPDFAQGLILAKSDMVGLEFLKIKHSKIGQRTLIPIENKAGVGFLESFGDRVGTAASRMILGAENNWKPKFIYSYGGGYCG